MKPGWKRSKKTAASCEDVAKENIQTIARLEGATRMQSSLGDKVADGITRFCGSMSFVGVHVLAFAFWISFNLWASQERRFDPYPFELLTLAVSLEAIFLSTFILISQNRDTKIAQRRSQLDLQVNLLAEQENTKMLQLIKQIALKMGVDVRDDQHLNALARITKPEKLAEQIEETLEKSERSPPSSNSAKRDVLKILNPKS